MSTRAETTGNDSGAANSAPRRGIGHVIALVLLGVALVWLIATTTLPLALAQRFPQLALLLNPNQPFALMTLADQRRAALLAISTAETRSDQLESANRFAAPELLAPAPEFPNKSREDLRTEIRSLASQIIAVDPLNARAYRLLAEVTDEEVKVRQLMQAAAARSRRESAAIFWLMNDSFQRGDFSGVLTHADVLLRSRGQLAPYVMSYLGQVAEDETARARLADMIADNPPWRSLVLKSLPRYVNRARTPGALFSLLRTAESPPTDAEFANYLSILLGKGLVDLAYSAWIEQLPQSKLQNLGLIYNQGFESEPNSMPFDWQLPNARNVIVEFSAVDEPAEGNNALHIEFGVGRAVLNAISQTLVLGPGVYQIGGKYRGRIVGERGLRWQVTCLMDRRSVLGQTEQIVGSREAWGSFSFNVTVPNNEDCLGQSLKLFHDARSASEQLVSGFIDFDDIRISRQD